jgi:hypothetical protein
MNDADDGFRWASTVAVVATLLVHRSCSPSVFVVEPCGGYLRSPPQDHSRSHTAQAVVFERGTRQRRRAWSSLAESLRADDGRGEAGRPNHPLRRQTTRWPRRLVGLRPRAESRGVADRECSDPQQLIVLRRRALPVAPLASGPGREPLQGRWPRHMFEGCSRLTTTGARSRV